MCHTRRRGFFTDDGLCNVVTRPIDPTDTVNPLYFFFFLIYTLDYYYYCSGIGIIGVFYQTTAYAIRIITTFSKPVSCRRRR